MRAYTSADKKQGMRLIRGFEVKWSAHQHIELVEVAVYESQASQARNEVHESAVHHTRVAQLPHLGPVLPSGHPASHRTMDAWSVRTKPKCSC